MLNVRVQKLRNRIVRLLRWTVGWACLVCLPPVEGQGEWSAGFARSEITPPLELTHWVTHQPYREALDPLEARALVLSDGAARVAVLVWDLVDAREGAVETVRAAIEDRTGIPSGQIVVQGTHTHSAPWSPPWGSRLLAHEQQRVQPVLETPVYQAWRGELVRRSVEAVAEADSARKPVRLSIAYASAGDMVFNRRPRRPDGSVQTLFTLPNPHVLPEGLRFHVTDPVMTVLTFFSEETRLGTLVHFACHPVSVYPFFRGISADWPGRLVRRIEADGGGGALFLQGCAGDLVPARRGIERAREMGETLSERALEASANSLELPAGVLRASRKAVRLPLNERAARDLAANYLASEVQAVSLGTVALVTLPGEPLVGLALEIQARSPFAHTLVLGYANGYGVGYVGLPGERNRGGYEAGEVGAGTDDCGGMLVATALEMLNELYGEVPDASRDEN